MKNKVNFIGVGAQKCGTTWIHRQLESHSQLSLASGKDKDTRFFSCFYDRGYEWYESHFTNGVDGNIDVKLGEVSTSYFYNIDAPNRIKQYNPEIKLFVCLRNPVERIVSNHRHEVRAGHITNNNLQLCHALENNPAYILQSRYAFLLKRWYECFNKDQIKVLFFDDLKLQPEKFMGELLSFIGVDETISYKNINQVANSARVPASKPVENTIKSASKIMRKVGLGKVIKLGNTLGFNLWLKGKNAISEEDNQIDLGVTNSVREFILNELNDDILELEKMTGRNLDAWKKTP